MRGDPDTTDWLVLGIATAAVVAICFIVGYWVIMR